MLNKVFLQGRLTKDPELRTTQNGKQVCSFTLAVDRDSDRGKADFVNCVAWNRTAQFVSNYFHRGQMAIATGSLQSREWTDKSDNKRIQWEVQVESVNFCEAKKQTADVSAPDFEELDDDEEPLPF